MSKGLIICHGFLGDNLLTQRLAEVIRNDHGIEEVHWLCGFQTLYTILDNNPYIDKVLISSVSGPEPSLSGIDVKEYDKVYHTKPHQGKEPLSLANVKSAGVELDDPTYPIYTIKRFDEEHKMEIEKLKRNGKPVVGVCLTWKSSLNNYAKIDISPIVDKLKEEYNLIPLGIDPNITQQQSHAMKNSEEVYARTASRMKYCDIVIGSEGGLTNVAAGVGTPVLYTTDFTFRLAGPMGTHWNHPDPVRILGPKAHFPKEKHYPLPYNITPESYPDEIYKKLKEIFND